MVQDKPLTLIIVRHGQTDHNARKIFQGQYDSHLNQEGIDQAELAGKRLVSDGIKVDKAWSSDLSRCSETLNQMLETSGQTEIPKVYTKNLRERYMGKLENMSIQTAREMADKEGKTFHDYGEPSSDVAVRMYKQLDEIIKDAIESNYDTVLVVSHGGSLARLVKHLLDDLNYKLDDSISEEDIKVPTNTAFTTVLIDKVSGIGTIVQYADASHRADGWKPVDQNAL